MLIFRSVNNIVIAPASTGSDRSSKITVIRTAQTNRGMFSNSYFLRRMFIIVVMKLSAPRIEEIPAKWSEKIAKSTEGPLCAMFLERGG